MFVLVHLSSAPDTSPVYYRLVDEVFINQMHAFLKIRKEPHGRRARPVQGHG